jgi:hypothetical protein
MHYRYFNSFLTYCHDFAGEDEIIFTIALCALAKATEHPVRLSEVNTAVSHFRDYGRPLHGWLYCAVEAAWGACARCDPPLAMQFVNDPVDALPTSEQAAKIRRQNLWNAVMSELRFPDRVEVDETGECPNTLPTRPELHRLIRATIGPQLRDRLERALGKAIITPEVRKKLAEIPLGSEHDLPDVQAERDRFWLIFDPDYLLGMPQEYLDYLNL